jgi:pyrroline-5-carboxylate reductase
MAASVLNKKLGVIGCGNMGEALIKGIVHAGLIPKEALIVSDVREDCLKNLKNTYGVSTFSSNTEVVSKSDIIILAVKPQIIEGVLKEIAPGIKPSHLIISVAAGITVRFLAQHLGEKVKVVRTMPNTPALIQEGATALCAGKEVREEDLNVAREIFQSVGKVVVVDESLMDAVTGLSGSGPAYFLFILEAFIDAGVKMGLTREVSSLLTVQTCLGTTKLLLATSEHPAKLRDKVTSPGGTTIYGLHALEEGGVRASLISAVEAATRRSRELGRKD